MAGLRKLTLGSVSALLFMTSFASAESLSEALSLAYTNNATLNATRAGLRSVDENVPQALSGYRPSINGSASATRSWRESEFVSGTSRRNQENSSNIGMEVQQILYRGNRTKNGVKKAESAVQAARENLKATEQAVLLDVATAYMDILQNQAILELRKQNVAFLQEQARSARDRFAVGETISTDVSQAEARLSSAISLVKLSEAQLASSRATYELLVGKKPNTLVAGYAVDNLFPKSLEAALSQGLSNHPSILAALHQVDQAQLDVKIAEGALLPTVSVSANAGRSWSNNNSGRNIDGATNSASITGAVNIPIFQGGATHSQVRQAKETLGQRRIQLDLARNQIRAQIVSSWSILNAAIPQIEAAQATVRASRLATQGVIEEQKVGQRTLLDVLDSQAELINARISLVQVQHDRIVASFSVASAVGTLSAQNLKLKVSQYNPNEHYEAVRDKWIGLRTPDGR
ncbi:outer membrane protein [Cohaesibacter sp. ES.047]|uniref:TolC family outer membrane protein n=1 Tax=Cohaesibacter sp. ES.047 TaxID=1798205 RepID=UPI000BBFE9DF|nr:TolC family outer membrane protein [Cohaesibacter sp. ES.047]SNY93289.1 outer membrane protein [Cohaesibacter sp. ES.047]